jgi:hypothetical protein
MFEFSVQRCSAPPSPLPGLRPDGTLAQRFSPLPLSVPLPGEIASVTLLVLTEERRCVLERQIPTARTVLPAPYGKLPRRPGSRALLRARGACPPAWRSPLGWPSLVNGLYLGTFQQRSSRLQQPMTPARFWRLRHRSARSAIGPNWSDTRIRGRNVRPSALGRPSGGYPELGRTWPGSPCGSLRWVRRRGRSSAPRSGLSRAGARAQRLLARAPGPGPGRGAVTLPGVLSSCCLA